MLKQSIALLVALLVGVAVFVGVESYSSSFQGCINEESAKAASKSAIITKIPSPSSFVPMPSVLKDSLSSRYYPVGCYYAWFDSQRNRPTKDYARGIARLSVYDPKNFQ
jgi:hypothetical protein